MFQAIQKRLRSKDEGFTLIELMVVVLIIAILIAIAIPTFLGARTKAQNRAAQTELRQGLLTAKDYYTETESFLDTAAGGTATTTAALYEAAEPSLEFDTAGSTTSVGVLVVDEDTVVLVRQSKSGDWFCISEEISEGTGYGSGAAVTNVDTRAECAANGW